MIKEKENKKKVTVSISSTNKINICQYIKKKNVSTIFFKTKIHGRAWPAYGAHLIFFLYFFVVCGSI